MERLFKKFCYSSIVGQSEVDYRHIGNRIVAFKEL